MSSLPSSPQRILIAGVGGTGCQVVHRLTKANLPGIDLLSLDTDLACIRSHDARRKIELIGAPVIGLGTGGHVDWARRCARLCEVEIRAALRECGTQKCDTQECCFLLIVAALGGGTGTGVAPILAQLAAQEGIPALLFLTLPLDFEGPRRGQIVREALAGVSGGAETCLVLPLERVRAATGESISLADFYSTASQVLCDCVLFLAGQSDSSKFGGYAVDGFQFIPGGSSVSLPLPNAWRQRLATLAASGGVDRPGE